MPPGAKYNHHKPQCDQHTCYCLDAGNGDPMCDCGNPAWCCRCAWEDVDHTDCSQCDDSIPSFSHLADKEQEEEVEYGTPGREVKYVRGEESGWVRIGRYDQARRRSLWCRLIGEDGMGHVQAIELCSGREGDDGYVKLTPDNPQWEELCNLLLRVEGDCGLKVEEERGSK